MSAFHRAVAVAFAVAVLSASALAADAAKKELTPQQQRMGACAHENKGKKGDEYKAGMKECLKSKKDAGAAAPAPKAATATPAATTTAAATAAGSQKDKMKNCNAEAKTKALKGADRKAFMSTCLKG
jgi:hypothetical protein